ncbi:MAG: Sir2 family NAD-dependent protein deacetylase [Dysosmobacter sp.]
MVTQNIDGLHQAAGSRTGAVSSTAAYTGITASNAENSTIWITSSTPQGFPGADCGGIIKPDVVLYEEGLDRPVIDGAVTRHRTGGSADRSAAPP